MTEPSPLHISKAWPLYAAMAVAAVAAILASVTTLAALAESAGWQGWTPWLLPASVDVGGAAGVWCWLRPGAPVDARRFGKWVALTLAAASLAGNALGHLIESRIVLPGPALIIVVGAIPAAVLIALAHLFVLLTASDPYPIEEPGVADPAPDHTPALDPIAAPDPIEPATRSESRSDRPAPTRSSRKRSTQSGTRSDPRTDDDLRLEVYAAIEAGHLKPAPGSTVPGAEPIRKLLHVHPDRARAIREEMKLRADLAVGQEAGRD